MFDNQSLLTSSSSSNLLSTQLSTDATPLLRQAYGLQDTLLPSNQSFQSSSAPDLVVSINAPNAALPGSDLSPIEVRVRNVGTAIARGTNSAGANGYMVDLMLSTDTTLPNDFATYSPNYREDVLLRGGRISNTPDLAPGEEFVFIDSGGIPADTPTRNYYLAARVDAGNKITELNETNNSSLFHVAISPDTAGNSADKARSIALSSQGKTYSDRIGGSDSNDYFAFSLGARNAFNLSLDGLLSNADVELYDIAGNLIQKSANQGTVSEAINNTLEAGAYRLRVLSADGSDTPYNLNLSVTPLLQGITTTGSDEQNQLFLQQSSQLINMDDLRRPVSTGGHPRLQGIDGTGSSIVVIDSGINLNHPFFGADRNRDGISDRIVYSFDYAGDDTNADDSNEHGTHVASIAAGLDPSGRLTGMAPGANIIALKVFPDGAGRVLASEADIEQALQWVVANARTFNIASVNLSLGSGNFDRERTFGLSDEYRALADLGVVVVTAAGNEYMGIQGVSNQSADPNTLSVGAVWDAAVFGNLESGVDRIASFSQRHATLLDIFAPGVLIDGAGLGDTPGTSSFTSSKGGTSMAAPHVAGIAALTQQLARQELGRQFTPDEFRNLIRDTGVTINDGDDEVDAVVNTGLNFKRIDMMGIANEILRRAGTLVPPPPTITLAATDSSASESGNRGTFTITRTGSLVAPLTVNYAIAGSATNGADYSRLVNSVTILSGSATTTILINPIDDSVFEGTESVTLNLATNPAYTLGTSRTGTVFITDNDVATGSIDLRGQSFDVVREPLNANDSFTVNYQVQNTGTANSGGFKVKFYLSSDDSIDAGDTFLGEELIASLAAGSSTSRSETLRLPNVWSASTWRAIGNGTYHIGMIVDADNEVRETNELNNRNTGELRDFDRVQINNTRPVVEIPLTDIFQFRPRHTGRGDREFDGNGPTTRITANLTASGAILNTTVSAFFEETKSDWTTFSGTTSRSISVSSLYPGWTIDSILSSTSDEVRYTDNDYALDRFSGSSRLVNGYTVQGDTDGGTFGGDDDPWVSVDFSSARVRLRPV